MRHAVLVMVLVGCADDPVCKAPAETTYDCEPEASAQTTSCVGGPTWQRYDEMTPAIVESPGVPYPDGCHVKVPECSAFSTGHAAREFICYAGHWSEPI